MNNNNDFVRLNASSGEKFFRRSAISSFGITRKVSTTAPTTIEVRVVYQTSSANRSRRISKNGTINGFPLTKSIM